MSDNHLEKQNPVGSGPDSTIPLLNENMSPRERAAALALLHGTHSSDDGEKSLPRFALRDGASAARKRKGDDDTKPDPDKDKPDSDDDNVWAGKWFGLNRLNAQALSLFKYFSTGAQFYWPWAGGALEQLAKGMSSPGGKSLGAFDQSADSIAQADKPADARGGIAQADPYRDAVAQLDRQANPLSDRGIVSDSAPVLFERQRKAESATESQQESDQLVSADSLLGAPYLGNLSAFEPYPEWRRHNDHRATAFGDDGCGDGGCSNPNGCGRACDGCSGGACSGGNYFGSGLGGLLGGFGGGGGGMFSSILRGGMFGAGLGLLLGRGGGFGRFLGFGLLSGLMGGLFRR